MATLARSRDTHGRAPAFALPELRFVGMAPTEALVGVVREQDSFYRQTVVVEPAATQVVIERLHAGVTTRYHVQVTASSRGIVRSGCAEHAEVGFALREAFGAVLRQTLARAPAPPCPRAA